MNLFAYTKKLSEMISFYDDFVRETSFNFHKNPFTQPVNITVIWVEDKNDNNF